MKNVPNETKAKLPYRPGQRIRKRFGNQYYFGIIMEVPTMKDQHYYVVYEDGDSETIDVQDIDDIIYNETTLLNLASQVRIKTIGVLDETDATLPYHLGKRIRKRFGERYYFGRIIKLPTMKDQRYLVFYEDGDLETIDVGDIDEFILH